MQKRLFGALIAGGFTFLGLLESVHADAIELVAQLPPETPPGNIAIAPDNRIFLSVHGFYNQPVKVVELLENGSTRPYPTEAWAQAPSDGTIGLHGVLGINVDSNGILWLLDTSSSDRSGRLIGWDTKSEQLHRIVYLAKPVIADHSFLNDLAIDLKNKAIYVADTGTQAIIVVDLSTGQTRRVLEGSEFTKAQDIDMIIDGKRVEMNGQPARLGVNPITIDPQNEYLYWGAMSGTAIYRIRTEHLNDAELTDLELAEHVEHYGEKPISDGITIDDAGNVYITSITDDSIGVTRPDGTYETLFQDDELSWPDGFAVGLDNYIYVTINELHRSPGLNTGQNDSQNEFKVMRFKALSTAQTGR
jgi:sugar lactone lactonase YvrE